MAVMIAAAEMERVIVARSREARGSSESERGRRVEVRGEGARLAPSIEFDGTGVVTRIVGGWRVGLLLSPETVMCRVPGCFFCTGERAMPAVPTRAGRGSWFGTEACWSSYIRREWFQDSR